MNKKQSLFAATAALVFAGSSALAADLPAKAPLYKAAPAYLSWTGFYIGGDIGGAWSRIDNSFVFPPPATLNQSRSTGIGGGFVGVQYQFSSLVLGVEGGVRTLFDRSLGSAPCNPTGSCAAGFVMTSRLDDPIWTIGGRAGFAINNWMPYFTGGFASTAIAETVCTNASCPLERGRSRFDGGYLGGGLDFQFWTGWVAGVEYRHYDFRGRNVVPVFTSGLLDTNDTYHSHPKLDTVTFRLSYLFNWMRPY